MLTGHRFQGTKNSLTWRGEKLNFETIERTFSKLWSPYAKIRWLIYVGRFGSTKRKEKLFGSAIDFWGQGPGFHPHYFHTAGSLCITIKSQGREGILSLRSKYSIRGS